MSSRTVVAGPGSIAEPHLPVGRRLKLRPAIIPRSSAPCLTLCRRHSISVSRDAFAAAAAAANSGGVRCARETKIRRWHAMTRGHCLSSACVRGRGLHGVRPTHEVRARMPYPSSCLLSSLPRRHGFCNSQAHATLCAANFAPRNCAPVPLIFRRPLLSFLTSSLGE